MHTILDFMQTIEAGQERPTLKNVKEDVARRLEKKLHAGGPGSGRRPGGAGGKNDLTHYVIDRYHGSFHRVASGPHTKEKAQLLAKRRNANYGSDDHTWHAVKGNWKGATNVY